MAFGRGSIECTWFASWKWEHVAVCRRVFRFVDDIVYVDGVLVVDVDSGWEWRQLLRMFGCRYCFAWIDEWGLVAKGGGFDGNDGF